MKILRIHSLEKGWCDSDIVLLHAAFQLLINFVEKEKPDRVIDWDADPSHKQAWEEIQTLYHWWTGVRPARKGPFDERKIKYPPFRTKKVPGRNTHQLVEPDRSKYAEYYQALGEQHQLELLWEREDQENLHRLVEVRRFLWT